MNIDMQNATTSVERHRDRQVTDDRIRSVGDIVGHRLLNAGAFNLERALKSFSRGRPIALQSASEVARHALSRLVHRRDFGLSMEPAVAPSLASDLLTALIAGNAIDDQVGAIAGEQLLVDAMIYCMLQQKAPISSAGGYLRAVHAVRPFAGDEIDAVFEAVIVRLAELEHFHVDAAAKAGGATAELLYRLAKMNWRFCIAIMRHSIGLEALPGADALARWLADSRPSFRSVLANPIEELTLEVIPFGVADHAIARLSAEARPVEAEAAWREIADARGIDVGVGPWGEVRTVYTSDMFRSALIDGARRTVHLGLDLFMPAGTKLFSPVEGIVAGIDIEPEMLSYGCLVTLIHRPADGVEFLSLWGHLAHEAASRLTVGDVVQAVDLVGSMGDHTENGGWAPHVHLQLCADTTLSPTEIIGVGEQPYMKVWAALFPPANAFAQVPVVGVDV